MSNDINLVSILMRKIPALVILFACGNVFAQACWDEAADRYQVNRDILRSLSFVESKFNRTATGKKNRNGTYDVCHMQVNSSHFPKLESFGITEKMLYARPCVCTEAGAWVLADCMRIFGNTWEAVGCYNAGTRPELRSVRFKYALKVQKAYQELTKDAQ